LLVLATGGEEQQGDARYDHYGCLHDRKVYRSLRFKNVSNDPKGFGKGTPPDNRRIWLVDRSGGGGRDAGAGGRLAIAGPRDELTELADTFDDMLARLESAFESQRR